MRVKYLKLQLGYQQSCGPNNVQNSVFIRIIYLSAGCPACDIHRGGWLVLSGSGRSRHAAPPAAPPRPGTVADPAAAPAPAPALSSCVSVAEKRGRYTYPHLLTLQLQYRVLLSSVIIYNLVILCSLHRDLRTHQVSPRISSDNLRQCRHLSPASMTRNCK